MEKTMTNEQIGGIVRTMAAAGFGALVARGVIDAETATALAGAVSVIAVAVWSVWSKKAKA